MRTRWVIALPLATVLATTPSFAQRAATPFPRFEAATLAEWTSLAPAVAAATFGHPDDHRWEGVIAGGLALGVASLVLTSEMCSGDSGGGCPIAMATLSGVTAGAVLGGLLGALIPKAPADSTH